MVNEQIRTLTDPDGLPVCNVAFDLSNEQLTAAAYSAGEILLERHRGADLETDAVLAMRELTGVRDELDRLAAADGHAHVVFPLARFAALHDALDEWVATRGERGWLREADRHALPIVDAMLAPMAQLRADAVAAVLGAETTSH